MASKNKCLESLKQVTDPVAQHEIVGLGYVKDIQVNGDRAVLTLQLPNYAPALKDQIKQKCVQALQSLKDITHVDTLLVPQVKTTQHTNAHQKPKILPQVRHVIAVASGKGGVGKSTVSSNLACALAQHGLKVGLMDADIYGPSVPVMFGVTERPKATQEGRVIPLTRHGLSLMSMGFLQTEKTPVIWRGPMVHQIITQFLSTVEWGALDCLVIDLPPGTGDAQLTLTQQAPLTGALIVTTPQDVSLIDAKKGLDMFQKVHVPVLGIIENMSGYTCKQCGHTENIFKHGGGQTTAKELNLPFLGEIPIDPEVVLAGDDGTPIVIRNPKSVASQAYQAIAATVAEKIKTSSVREEAPLADLNMQWKKS